MSRTLWINPDILDQMRDEISLNMIGSVALIAMHIAMNGPINIADISRIGRLDANQDWLTVEQEGRLFVRIGEQLDLNDYAFIAEADA